MTRLKHLPAAAGLAMILACGALWAADPDGQPLLDKAIQTKLTAETMADLERVIKLCRDVLEAGLSDNSKVFANSLLAGTLSQRAELICVELFERPQQGNRGPRLAQMAIEDLQETLKIDPEQGEAQFLLGRLYATMGEPEKALSALNHAIRLLEDDPASLSRALMIRARLRDDPELQASDLNKAIELQPHDADALRLRATFHLSQGKLTSAASDLRDALALDPDDADTHESLAVVLSMLERYDEAISSLNRAIELAPDSISALSHRARLKAMRNDTPGALADVETALKLKPGSVTTRLLKAQLLAGSGKLDDAVAELNGLLAAMPNNSEILLQIAMLCQAAKQHDRALAAYDKTIDADPRSAAAFRGRADVFLSLGKQSDAIHDYEAAIKIEPDNSGALNNLAWVLATSPDAKLRDGKRAIELAKLACEVTEYREAHILSTLAAAYAEIGDFDTAINWSTKAVDLGKDDLKSQLAKELESYKVKEPWREAAPPDELAPIPARPAGAIEGAAKEGATESK